MHDGSSFWFLKWVIVQFGSFDYVFLLGYGMFTRVARCQMIQDREVFVWRSDFARGEGCLKGEMDEGIKMYL